VRFCDSQSTALDLVLDRNTRRILDHIDEIRKKQIETESQKDIEQRKSKILESLVHGNPFTRENDILNKHDGTFEWIFDEGPETGSTFLSWLRSDGGIFWIQGKPGSGKSTLIKFLCTSTDRIDQSLQRPATAKAYVFYSFYFWLADGAKLQNTERGLLCSLLCQFLDTSWTLDSSYLTDARLRQKKTQGNWDFVELRSLVLLAADTLLTDCSVCVFVDALDECQPEDLARVLILIKQLSSRGVNVCVSSRPEQRIINKLEADATEILKVDLYTKNDITRFVQDEFEAVDLGVGTLSPQDLEHLADQIVGHADGVFLWATLMAKDVCKGIENGDDFCQLFDRTRQTSGDLDALYQNMLSRIGPDLGIYMAEAGSYFSLALHFESNHALCFSPHGDLPLFHCLPVYKTFQRIIPDDREHNLDLLLPRVEARINVVCAGMLVCGQPLADSGSSIDSSFDSSSHPSWRDRRVRFIHRTAHDFFLESNSQFTQAGCLSLFELWRSATSGFLMACRFYGLSPRDASICCNRAIRDLAYSQLKPAEKVKLLECYDRTMQEIFQAKHWLYRQLSDRERWLDILDLLGMALYDAFDLELVDCFCGSRASLSPRYKTYLLLHACSRPCACPKAIQSLISSGADPNQAMFTSIFLGSSDFRTKTSPWIKYMADRGHLGWGKVDQDVIQALVENGADITEISLWHASLSSRTAHLDAEWGSRQTCPDINLVLLANARYAAEALLGASLQSFSAKELPAAYCKVLGFLLQPPVATPTDVGAVGPSKSSFEGGLDSSVPPSGHPDDNQSNLANKEPLFAIGPTLVADSSPQVPVPDVRHSTSLPFSRPADGYHPIALSEWPHNVHLYPVSEELLSDIERVIPANASADAKPKSPLQRLLRDIQHSFRQTPVNDLGSILDEITEYQKQTSSVTFLSWALENGYFIKDTDPAALFPDYEKFRGENGYIDIDALFGE
jgi:hypothetical protein